VEIKRILDEIAGSRELPAHSHLADLSQLTETELTDFRHVFSEMTADRRYHLLARLEELAQDNIELNFDIIFKSALSDPDSRVRKQAIESLWENEDTALIRTYAGLMERDTAVEVKAAAATALGKYTLLVEMEEIDGGYREFLSQTLLKTFNDASGNIEVRRRALEAAAPLTIPAVQDAIRHAYDSRDERLTVSAIFSMGRTCNEAWLPVLYKELKSPDAEIRYEAAGAIGQIGSENSVHHLNEILYDPDVEVRQAAIQALGEIGGKEAKQYLTKIAEDADETIREAVQAALAELQQRADLNIW